MGSLLADLKRELIRKRTKESLELKKSMGIKLGRQKSPRKLKLESYKEQIQGYLDKDISFINIARLLDISYTIIYNFIQKNKLLKGSIKTKMLSEKQKVEKTKLYLGAVNMHKGGRGIKQAIDNIKAFVLPKNEPDETIQKLLLEIHNHAKTRN